MLKALQSIPQTFYSRDFYANLILHGKGIGMGFILLNLLFSYVGPMLVQLPKLPEAQHAIEDFFDRLPDVTIKNHKLSIDRNSPYAVEMGEIDEDQEEQNSFVVMFDTSRESKDIAVLTEEMKEKNIFVLLTSDFAAIRKNRGDAVEIHDYNNIENTEITHDRWLEIGGKVARYFPLIFVVAIIPIFLIYLVFTFFKGLIVKVLALFFRNRPELAGAMRLGAAASIPVSVVSCALAFIGALSKSAPIVLPAFMTFIIWIGLVVFGLSAANKAAAQPN